MLEKVFERLHQNHLKVNWTNVFLALGRSLTLVLCSHLRASNQAETSFKLFEMHTQPPTNIKMVRSFVGLCNFFWKHIKDFTIIATPLFKVTRKDSGYKSGPLPPEALHAFKVFQQQLISDLVMAFPRSD